MTQYRVNVIVTAYNNGKYIKDCLESIIKQKETYESFKITIGYDLGSEDDTYEICKEYEDKYDYIKIASFKHSTVGFVRNAVAFDVKEEYLMFVDGDDLLVRGALRTMIDIATEKRADCVVGRIKESDKYGRGRNKDVFIENTRRNTPFLRAIHPILLKTKLYNEKLFCTHARTHEDRLPGCLIPKLCKVVHLNEVVYIHRIHDKSLIGTVKNRIDMLDDIIQAFEDIKKQRNLFSDDELEAIKEDLVWSAISVLLLIYDSPDEERKNNYIQVICLLDWIFPGWDDHYKIKKLKRVPIIGRYVKVILSRREEEYIKFTNGFRMKIIRFIING